MKRLIRGQLSIDLLLGVIALAVFLAILMNAYNTSLEAQAGQQDSLNEAKSILLDAYATVGSVQAYGQSVNYVSPAVKQNPGNNTPCTITAQLNLQGTLTVQIGNPVTATAAYSGIDLSKITFTDNSQNPPVTVNSFSCGSAIMISRSP